MDPSGRMTDWAGIGAQRNPAAEQTYPQTLSALLVKAVAPALGPALAVYQKTPLLFFAGLGALAVALGQCNAASLHGSTLAVIGTDICGGAVGLGVRRTAAIAERAKAQVKTDLSGLAIGVIAGNTASLVGDAPAILHTVNRLLTICIRAGQTASLLRGAQTVTATNPTGRAVRCGQGDTVTLRNRALAPIDAMIRIDTLLRLLHTIRRCSGRLRGCAGSAAQGQKQQKTGRSLTHWLKTLADPRDTVPHA